MEGIQEHASVSTINVSTMLYGWTSHIHEFVYCCRWDSMHAHKSDMHLHLATHPQHVKPDIVKLLVIENLMLQPCSDVYILPLSFVDYRVERRKQGRTEVVPMPSDQYTLELTNTTVGRLDRRRSRVIGLVIGDTEIVLQDKSMFSSISLLYWKSR